MKLFILTLFSVSTLATGNGEVNKEQREEMFNKMKSEILKDIDKRISYMQENKTCINSASSRDDLKNCREAVESKMEALREERKQKRSARKASRKSRRGSKGSN